jgi:hypothetical protein
VIWRIPITPLAWVILAFKIISWIFCANVSRSDFALKHSRR